MPFPTTKKAWYVTRSDVGQLIASFRMPLLNRCNSMSGKTLAIHDPVLVRRLRDFLCTFVYKHEIWHRCRPEHTELIF